MRGSAYEDLDTLKDANGLIARISRRLRTGEVTFAVFKMFERDGEPQQTSFIPLELADAYIAMATNAKQRCIELAKDLPPPTRNGRGRR